MTTKWVYEGTCPECGHEQHEEQNATTEAMRDPEETFCEKCLENNVMTRMELYFVEAYDL